MPLTSRLALLPDNARVVNNDFAIVVGDLVSRGTPEQFAEYYVPPIRRHCDFPVLPVPGNHDIRGKGEAYEDFLYEIVLGDEQLPEHVESESALLYDPDANRLYYASDTMLVVVDGAADTIIARFNVAKSRSVLTFSRASHRLYHAGLSAIDVFNCPPPVHAAIGETGPTLISREITLLGTNPADLIDVTGRRVLRLTPGLNRLDALPAGVYYLHRPIDRYTQKVILRP